MDRELLPRVFTLTLTEVLAVIFCGPVCPYGLCIRKAFLLGSMVPCVVPTFLLVTPSHVNGDKMRCDKAIERAVALQK